MERQAIQGSMDAIHKLLERLSSTTAEEGSRGIDHASLAQACIYVLDMPLPPKKRRHCASTCCVTGISLKGEVKAFQLETFNPFFFLFFCKKQEGIEISKDKCMQDDEHEDTPNRKRKTPEKKKKKKLPCTNLVIHPRFMHFMHMVWLIGRIDHILRSMVRCWQHTSRRTGSCSGSIEDCHIFMQDMSSEIKSLGVMFSYAISHIDMSLRKSLEKS